MPFPAGEYRVSGRAVAWRKPDEALYVEFSGADTFRAVKGGVANVILEKPRDLEITARKEGKTLKIGTRLGPPGGISYTRFQLMRFPNGTHDQSPDDIWTSDPPTVRVAAGRWKWNRPRIEDRMSYG